jgi:hypothetical protein
MSEERNDIDIRLIDYFLDNEVTPPKNESEEK